MTYTTMKQCISLLALLSLLGVPAFAFAEEGSVDASASAEVNASASMETPPAEGMGGGGTSAGGKPPKPSMNNEKRLNGLPPGQPIKTMSMDRQGGEGGMPGDMKKGMMGSGTPSGKPPMRAMLMGSTSMEKGGPGGDMKMRMMINASGTGPG